MLFRSERFTNIHRKTKPAQYKEKNHEFSEMKILFCKMISSNFKQMNSTSNLPLKTSRNYNKAKIIKRSYNKNIQRNISTYMSQINTIKPIITERSSINKHTLDFVKYNLKQKNDSVMKSMLKECEYLRFGLKYNDVCKDKLTRIQKLWRAIDNMKRLKLTPEDFKKKNIFPEQAYQTHNARRFFTTVKFGDYNLTSRYLIHNKFLVFEFDYVLY